MSLEATCGVGGERRGGESLIYCEEIGVFKAVLTKRKKA